MNVYDFDGTIYDGDCTLDFWKFCIFKYPQTLLTLLGSLIAFLQFKCGLLEREYFKQQFYKFLKYIPDVKQEVQLFWNNNMKKIKPWYYERKEHDDLVITASPEFLIQEVCQRLGIRYIASKVDWKTGRLQGANCRGQEKVRCFEMAYPDVVVQAFYSDSKSDEPMAILAQQAFMVKKEQIEKWQFKNEH